MKNIYVNKNIVGADETGVGDYLTPLISAAVFVPAVNVRKMINLGITDSKKITDSKILELFEKIKPMIKSSIRIMSQSQYNFLTKKYNANELKMYLHMQAIKSIENRVDNIDIVILDAFSNDSSLDKYRKKISKEENIKDWESQTIYITKGEMEHVAVAAASIVARAYFVKFMEKQNKKWEMIFPLGTNLIVENFAKEFIKKHGKENLYNVAKLSFKTTKKILDQ
ncbi:MAG: ribonuclease HIII [Mycoplasmatales bacterium]|nr:ribonuclease HIII [Mycoplasmatales bacterium]